MGNILNKLCQNPYFLCFDQLPLPIRFELVSLEADKNHNSLHDDTECDQVFEYIDWNITNQFGEPNQANNGEQTYNNIFFD